MPGKPLTRTIADLINTGRVMRLTCADCGHKGEADLRSALTRFGMDAEPQEVIKRLVCSRCGGKRIEAIVSQRDGF